MFLFCLALYHFPGSNWVHLPAVGVFYCNNAQVFIMIIYELILTHIVFDLDASGSFPGEHSPGGIGG